MLLMHAPVIASEHRTEWVSDHAWSLIGRRKFIRQQMQIGHKAVGQGVCAICWKCWSCWRIGVVDVGHLCSVVHVRSMFVTRLFPNVDIVNKSVRVVIDGDLSEHVQELSAKATEAAAVNDSKIVLQIFKELKPKPQAKARTLLSSDGSQAQSPLK